jgi:hypothetical protein
MKIVQDKTFSPINLKIETKEELKLFQRIVHNGYLELYDVEEALAHYILEQIGWPEGDF